MREEGSGRFGSQMKRKGRNKSWGDRKREERKRERLQTEDDVVEGKERNARSSAFCS